jgi:hypothetical protein
MGHFEAMLVWAPLATLVVALMMPPSLIRKFPRQTGSLERNPRLALYMGSGCLGVLVATMIALLALPH